MSKRHQHLNVAASDEASAYFDRPSRRAPGRNRKVEAPIPPKASTPVEREQRAQKYTKHLVGRSSGQLHLMEAIDNNDFTFALGPAGCGKTYLAVSKALEAYRAGRVTKIILARPAVEAGERLGFMPGDMNEKISPYMRPLYDALYDWVSPAQVAIWLDEGVIEIVPVAFMRGRTFKNVAIVVDEAQNATLSQLKMILTRLGERSFMVITGDPDQSDLKSGESGLLATANALDGIRGVSTVRLSDADIVRHPLLKLILPRLNTIMP